MIHATADELIRIVDAAARDLRTVTEAAAAAKPRSGIWSIKETIGHLVDSAANNHQRFVRAQLAPELTFPGYEQDGWVQSQGYQHRPWPELIDLWTLYNHHLAHVIRRVPDAVLDTPCQIGAAKAVTLGFLIEDYLVHLRHHLRQIEERKQA